MKTIIIDENNLSNIKNIIKKYKNNNNIKMVLNCDTNDEYKSIVYCFNIKDKRKRMSYIYDYLCDYIDNDMKEKNYCDFVDGKCIANRLGYSLYKDNGCCYSRGKLCTKLVNGCCTNKNPSCKIFMCYYLNHVVKVKNYNTRKILLTSIFFNNYDHIFFKMHYFISKEEFLNKYFNSILVK